MKIKLHYNADDRFGGRVQIREFEVPEGTDISKILPQVHGSGLAIRVDDPYGGHVEGNYIDSGKLKEGVTYRICSANIPKTIKALDRLKELKF